MEAHPMNQLVGRMLGAAQLKVSTYEEVEADTKATGQAALVVVIVAIATGIGTFGTSGVPGFIAGIVVGLIGWALWAWIIYFIGTTFFRTPETHANWGQLARTLGFAQSPGVLKVFGVMPVFGGLIYSLISIWQLVAMVVAVRQALDYRSTWRAVGVVVVGFIPYLILTMLIYVLLGSSS